MNLTIEGDEFVALLGRSGTGKSTLLRILGGLDPDYEGEVLVPERRAVVFQEARLVPWLRVLGERVARTRLSPRGSSGAARTRARGAATKSSSPSTRRTGRSRSRAVRRNAWRSRAPWCVSRN